MPNVTFKLNLKIMLGISYSLTKNIEHLGFFKEKIVIVNVEFFLYLNPLIFKSRVYSVK